MPLTNEEIERFKKWCEDKRDQPCPCGATSSALMGELNFLPMLDRSNNKMAMNLARGAPVLACLCDRCGALTLFSALHLGFLSEATEMVIDARVARRRPRKTKKSAGQVET